MRSFDSSLPVSCRVGRVALTAFVMFVFVLGSFQNGHAQWKRAAGWTLDAHNGTLSQVKGFLPFGNKLLADVLCATSSNGTPDSLFVSTDNGQSWAPFSSSGGEPLIANGTNLVGIADSFSNGMVISWISYSTNQGQNWIADSVGFPASALPGGMVVAGNSIIASAGFYGFYKQTGPGTPWTVDTIGASVGGQPIPVGVLALSGNTILAGAIVAGIMASTDNGGTWNLAVNGIPEIMQGGQPAGWPTVWQLGVIGKAVYAVTETDPNNPGTWTMYRSSDNGQNWTVANATPIAGGADGNATWMAGTNQILFFSTDSGVFISKDNGTTWTINNSGLYPYDQTGFYTTAVQIAGGNVVLGTADSGIWYRPLSDFGISGVAATPNGSSHLGIALSENPAGGLENAIISAPEAGPMRVELVDEMGRSVQTLLHGPASQGPNPISFNTQSLVPGTYFLRVEADGSSAIEKITVDR